MTCIQLLNVFISLIQEYKITAVITILTTQKSGFEITEEDLFSLLQNIIVLRFVEVQGRMKRVLLVLKIRGSQHDESILEFKIIKGQWRSRNNWSDR